MRLATWFSPWRVAASLHISYPDRLPPNGINRYSSTLEPPRSASSLPQDDHSSKTVTRDPLRLMPLGGSVTRGVGSSDGTGYRKSLLKMLQLHGLNVRMVGSRKDGSMPNNEHEGWRGLRIDEIERKARKSVEGLSPNVFIVNAGSNDCLQSFKIAEAGKRMGDMLDYLWLASPQSMVILSTLLVNVDEVVDSTVKRVNDQFRALAEKKATEQKKIVLVDMYTSEGPDVHGLIDGIHPDDDGYNKMARLWFRGIQEALQKGLIDGMNCKF